jgi:hypothetical protein
MVEDVERFGTELEMQRLANRKIAANCEIDLGRAESAHKVSGRVPWTSAGRQRKGSGSARCAWTAVYCAPPLDIESHTNKLVALESD